MGKCTTSWYSVPKRIHRFFGNETRALNAGFAGVFQDFSRIGSQIGVDTLAIKEKFTGLK